MHYGLLSWGKYRVKAVESCKPKTIWNFSPPKFARAAPTVSRAKAMARTLLDTLEALYYLHNNCVCASVCGFAAIVEHPHSFPSSSSTQQSHDDSSGDQNVSHGLGRHLKLHSSRSKGHQIPHDVCVCVCAWETSDLSPSRPLFSWRVRVTGSRRENDGL